MPIDPAIDPSEGGAETLETSLYPPVKRYLEKLGLAVKGEIRGCDVVGLAADGLVVVCELKLSFNLELVLQGVDRSAACEEVWLAVRSTARATSRERDPRVRKLCRLLGFGLLAVSARGQVEPVVEPRPGGRAAISRSAAGSSPSTSAGSAIRRPAAAPGRRS